MLSDPTIRLFDIAACAASVVGLADPELSRHMIVSAHIAHSIGEALGMQRTQCTELLIAGLLHDIAALDHKDRIALMRFEFETTPDGHQQSGKTLLAAFEPLRNVARIVGAHHTWWQNDPSELAAAHVMHLGDRVAVLIQPEVPVLGQVEGILAFMRSQAGKMFSRDHIDALMTVAQRESFWLDAVSPDLHWVLRSRAMSAAIDLDLESLSSITRLFTSIIDFRSRYTSTHSSGVAAVAEGLAERMGFSTRECRLLRIAGFLHDLGKLAVPCRVLDKPGTLTKAEFDLVKTHPYHTIRILRRLPGFDGLATLAASHHERLDGQGYPFRMRHGDLSLAARVLAVADVYAALTEDRPHRRGMDADEAFSVLNKKAEAGEVDKGVVDSLRNTCTEVDLLRIASQTSARDLYETVRPPSFAQPRC